MNRVFATASSSTRQLAIIACSVHILPLSWHTKTLALVFHFHAIMHNKTCIYFYNYKPTIAAYNT